MLILIRSTLSNLQTRILAYCTNFGDRENAARFHMAWLRGKNLNSTFFDFDTVYTAVREVLGVSRPGIFTKLWKFARTMDRFWRNVAPVKYGSR